MTEAEQPGDEGILRAIAPYVQAAVAAAATRNMPGIGVAWRAILPYGERSLLLALAALAQMATVGVKLPPGADGFMPVIFKPGSRIPVDPDAPEHAALAFAGRFCAAGAAGDRAMQQDLFAALLLPLADDEPDLPATARAADAFAVLTQLAANGVAREVERRRRSHRHPRAPRRSPNGHRRHR